MGNTLPCVELVNSLLDALDWYIKEPRLDSLTELALCYVELAAEPEKVSSVADLLARADERYPFS